MTTVNLILWIFRGGQIAGAQILKSLLEQEGCQVRLCISSEHLPTEEFRADCNIFSSELSPAWMRLAPRNVLFPNHEQDVRQAFALLDDHAFGAIGPQLPYLHALDRIFVKTRCAEGSYRSHGLKAIYTGFTCRDRWLPEVAKTHDEWLCVIGDNFSNKDLPAVIAVWRRNPGFPKLTICIHNMPPDLALPGLPNVAYRTERLRDEELRLLQNRCAVHVCASISEGWGHTIMEAMSTGALLLALAGAPMNELADETRAINFGYKKSWPVCFGPRFDIDEVSLEQTVRRVLRMNPQERASRGQHAREFFLANHRAFVANFRGEWRSFVARWPTDPPAPAPVLPAYARADAASPSAQLFKTARDVHRAGRFQEAQAIYRRILAAQPENADALHFLGLALFQQGRSRAAMVSFFRAIQLDPDVARYYRNVASILAGGRQPEAAAVFQEHAKRLTRKDTASR